ncbi:hypothetical protein Q8A73_001412 [Channa argus]|nr:hypothetical protein Q8A73_001412 [Channa argus]
MKGLSRKTQPRSRGHQVAVLLQEKHQQRRRGLSASSWSTVCSSRRFNGFSLQRCLFAPEAFPGSTGSPLRNPPLQLRCVCLRPSRLVCGGRRNSWPCLNVKKLRH